MSRSSASKTKYKRAGEFAFIAIVFVVLLSLITRNQLQLHRLNQEVLAEEAEIATFAAENLAFASSLRERKLLEDSLASRDTLIQNFLSACQNANDLPRIQSEFTIFGSRSFGEEDRRLCSTLFIVPEGVHILQITVEEKRGAARTLVKVIQFPLKPQSGYDLLIFRGDGKDFAQTPKSIELTSNNADFSKVEQDLPTNFSVLGPSYGGMRNFAYPNEVSHTVFMSMADIHEGRRVWDGGKDFIGWSSEEFDNHDASDSLSIPDELAIGAFTWGSKREGEIQIRISIKSDCPPSVQPNTARSIEYYAKSKVPNLPTVQPYTGNGRYFLRLNEENK